MGQISKLLPLSAWKTIAIEETGEPLVEILESARIVYGLTARANKEARMVRKTVAEMITRASELLPTQYKLVITEAYRSVESQKIAWDRAIQKIKLQNPHLSQEAIEMKVRRVVAKPSPLANHNCGGAVDVGLVHTKGVTVDMGTAHLAQTNPTGAYERYPMFPNTLFRRLISKEQEANRKILRDAMIAIGFVWYPGEWWHYCYGDRMWAVYTGQKECFYGPVKTT